MKRSLVISGDGSHTLKAEDLNEHYHSTYGAISESLHVFIKAGLYHKLEEIPCALDILEIGFGTGLNALLTATYTRHLNLKIKYVTLDAYPVEEELTRQLNYPAMIDHHDAAFIFEKLHAAEWNKNVDINEGFMLQKILARLEDHIFKGSLFDLIYYDAFGPDVQPGLWTEEIFRKIAAATSPGGVVVTYSCKGSVKRALQVAGFEIEKLPGPEGKREMLRGVRR